MEIEGLLLLNYWLAQNLLMKKNIHLLELNLKSYIANIFRIQLNQYCVIFIPIILMQTIG